MGEQLEVPLSLDCLFLPRGPWWWEQWRLVVGGGWCTWTACLWGMHHIQHTHSIPSTATSTTPPPPIRMSELELLTAVTGPAQGGDRGGRCCCCCRGMVHLFGSCENVWPPKFDAAAGTGEAHQVWDHFMIRKPLDSLQTKRKNWAK